MKFDWIDSIDEEVFNKSFPVLDALNNSVYYPSCGHDLNLIQHFQDKWQNYVYCDYGLGKYTHSAIEGFHLKFSRTIELKELYHSWQNEVRKFSCDVRRNYSNYLEKRHRIFKGMDVWRIFKEKNISWSIYEHEVTMKRYSLIFVSNDGVGSYYGLYHAFKTYASCVAIIQDGSAFGGNWTSFKNDVHLRNAVLSNPSGKPQYLIYGGRGVDYEERDIWGYYSHTRIINPYYISQQSKKYWNKAEGFGEINLFEKLVN